MPNLGCLAIFGFYYPKVGVATMAANNQPVCLPSQATTQSSLCNHLQTNYSDAVGDEHGQDNLPSSPPDISAPAESRPNDSSSHDDCGWGTHNTQYNDQAIDQAWGPFGFEAAQVDTMQGNGMWDQPLEETMQMNTWEPVDPHVHAYQAGFEPANTQPYATMNTGMPGGTSYSKDQASALQPGKRDKTNPS